MLLKKQGVSNRKIATAVGMNKETVNNYMKKVNADSLSIDELLKLEDPELEYRLKGGNPAYTDERFEKFKEFFALSGVGDAAQACHATTSVGRIPPRQP